MTTMKNDILLEGGNVFKDDAGSVLTVRINRADVLPTVQWLETVTGIELTDNMLGTTGKKETSGDLDLAIDANAVNKDEFAAKLGAYIEKQGGNPKEWIRKSGISVHFKTPIKGDEKNGYVQTDFMFGEPQWMKWSMQGGREDLSAEQLAAKIKASGFIPELGYTLNGMTFEIKGIETIDNKACYLLYTNDGTAENFDYYDAATYLKYKTISVRKEGEQTIETSITYNDYQNIDGYLFAQKYIINMGKMSFNAVVKSIQVNPKEVLPKDF